MSNPSDERRHLLLLKQCLSVILMEPDKWYDLSPPANILDEIFPRAQCTFKVPGKQEYVMEGIPNGGTEKKSFVLIFTKTGRVKPVISKDQT